MKHADMNTKEREVVEESELDELILELEGARLHVHFRDGAEIGVYSKGVYFSTDCDREELDVLILALKNNVEAVAVSSGNALIEISAEGDANGDPGDLIVVGLSHRDSDFVHKALIQRAQLIQLLKGGCENSTPPPKSNCEASN